MTTRTKTPKAAKRKTAALKVDSKATKAARKSSDREDERVTLMLDILVKNPKATETDLASMLKEKKQTMSDSAIRLVKRGWVQSVRALTRHKLLTKEIDLG
jgi:hypothetical protein